MLLVIVSYLTVVPQGGVLRRLKLYFKVTKTMTLNPETDPNGIRTRVTAVKGRCPRPLDDRVKKSGNIGIAIVRRKPNW